MTLIIILIGILVEHFIGISGEIRRFNWFFQYVQWLENRFGQYKHWSGAVGVVITLAGPLLVIWIIDTLLANLFLPLEFLFALAILLYSMGPRYLDPLLDDYINAIEDGNAARMDELVTEFAKVEDTGQQNEQAVIENILIQANERLFGVIFWFLVLGPFGALMYRLANQLRFQRLDIHGNYSDSIRDLCDILNWPSARLFALGNALSGNLVDAFEAWRETEKESLQVNEAVIKASGLGALQYRPRLSPDDEPIPADTSYWMRSLQGLLNRTLVVWLTVLGLMTLAGWMW